MKSVNIFAESSYPMKFSLAYLLLGSNRGDRSHLLKRARDLVSIHAGNIVLKSTVYETEPWGFTDDRPFLNQALLVRTTKSPAELLQTLNMIEDKLGRQRTAIKYMARTIDIDILLYNHEIIETERLKIPHPSLHLRKFTLAPLAEIAGGFVHPILQKPIDILLAECPDTCSVKKHD